MLVDINVWSVDFVPGQFKQLNERAITEALPAPRNHCEKEAIFGGQFKIGEPSALHYKTWQQYEVNAFNLSTFGDLEHATISYYIITTQHAVVRANTIFDVISPTLPL